MVINGKLVGDFEVKRVRYYPDQKLREAITVLKVKVRQEDGAKIWGDDFMGVAFNGLRKDADGNVSWCAEELTKPALVCETHQVKLGELVLEVQPEIKKIKRCKEEAAVVVPLTMRIDFKTKKIAGEIGFAADKVAEFTFDGVQVQVPGSNANAPALRTVPGPHGTPTPSRV
jgi:hypothetical protein